MKESLIVGLSTVVTDQSAAVTGFSVNPQMEIS